MSFDEQSLIDDMLRVFKTSDKYIFYKHIEQEVDCDKVCLALRQLNFTVIYKILDRDEIETKILFVKEK